MGDFFDAAQDIEGCSDCVLRAAARESTQGGYTWFGALRGWDRGCRRCYEKIEAVRISFLEAPKEI